MAGSFECFISTPVVHHTVAATKFCMEGWIRFPDVAALPVEAFWLAQSATQDIRVSFLNPGVVRAQIGATILADFTLPFDALWHHVAFTYDAITARLFYDGTVVESSAVAFTTESGIILCKMTPNSANTPAFQGPDTASAFDECRFLVDAAIYTSNFTPPSGPFA